VRGLLQAAALQIRHDALDGWEVAGVGLQALDPGAQRGFDIKDHDVLGHGDKHPSISFFAAGIGIMFLMFGVAGRSAILIEERETGVLTRLLAARVTLTQLLVGRWLFLVALGSVQVCVMFTWGWLVFGLDLWTPRHLAGFGVMTAVSAAAAAGFGLMLSAACRSRAQLTGLATVLILILSALGGSLFPSFLMPEGLRRLGRIAFNAWALEGYQKVFWYDVPVRNLLPQVVVLLVSCLSFLLLARWLIGQRIEA
jgi:ABC-2 type transport system permease protein